MQSERLAAIVHVPKTAGTAINSSLESLKLPGRSHCEAFIDNPDVVARELPRLKWISGHVPHKKLLGALAVADGRTISSYAAVRSPLQHVASHYNWLIEIFKRSPEFYNGHPENIRSISLEIRETDNSSPTDIIRVLRKYPGLFLNYQSRYLIEDGPNPAIDRIRAALARFDYVGHEKTIGTLLCRIAQTDARVVRDNASPYHFDKDVFNTPELTEFLGAHNALDERLYSEVCKTWPS